MTTTYQLLGATITITTTHDTAERLSLAVWWVVGLVLSPVAIVVGYTLGSM